MKGDFSRLSFSPEKRYHGVRMQQGRVQTDADWNELARMQEYLQQATSAAFIGDSGTPRYGGGFAVSVVPGQQDFAISPGRYFVDGFLCELFADANGKGTTYLTQPDLPNPPAITSLPAGRYALILDVWTRHITALEDPSIADPALNGMDTTTRLQTVWQARTLPLPAGYPADQPIDFGRLLPASGLRMKARANPQSGVTSGTMLPPGSGYRRMDNQLYRVEIHDPPNGSAPATLKWSRENGSVAAAWVDQKGYDLILSYPGRDESLDFSIGDWIELIDDTRELLGQRGVMVQVAHVEGHILTINPPKSGTISRADFPRRPKVRRWDMDAGPIAAPKNTWIAIEEGVEVWFEGDGCSVGDYWLIPARAATRDIEWPQSGNAPVARSPHGTRHRYVALAQFDWDGSGIVNLVDRRLIFPSLNDLGWGRTSGDAIGINTARDYVRGVEVTGQTSLDGRVALNDHPMYLRGISDVHHGLGWAGARRPFDGRLPDGPVLFGYSGGALGTVSTPARGVVGSVVMDGNGDYVALPALGHDFSQGFSIDAWVRYDALLNYSRIVDLGTGPGGDNILLANKGTSNALCLNVVGTGGLGEFVINGALDVGPWMHIAATVDAQGNARMYKNGSLIGTGRVNVPRAGISRNQSFLGKSNWATDSTMDGALANVRLWTRPLSAGEVMDYAKNTISVTATVPGLVGFWRLADGKGSVAVDASRYAQDGTLVGNARFESYQRTELTWDHYSRGVAVKGQLTTEGRVHLNGQMLYLRTNGASRHGLGYHGGDRPWAGQNVDGPVLYGAAGGALGTVSYPQQNLMGAVVLDGNNGYVDLGAVGYDFSRGLTLEAWVQYDALKNWARIFDIGTGPDGDNLILANQAATNALCLNVRQGATGKEIVTANTTAAGIEIGVWTHIAATVDATGYGRIYKNGVQVAAGPLWLPRPGINRNKAYIGKSNWANEYLDGRVANARLWTRALSQGEINDYMNNYLQAYADAPGLVAELRMAEGAGTTARDSSQYAQNATLVGGASFETYQRSALSWDSSNNVEIAGATSLGSTLAVTGGTTLGSTLAVTGAATLGNTLAVTGPATLGNTLSVTGATTISNTLTTTGAAVLGGTLTVTSNPLWITSSWSNKPATGTNYAEISNDTSGFRALMIIGNRSNGATSPGSGRRVAVWDILEVNGNLIQNTTGTTTLNGATTINNALTVTGATTIGGATTINNALTVTGATTLSGDLTSTGRLKGANTYTTVTASSVTSYACTASTWQTVNSMTKSNVTLGSGMILVLVTLGGVQANSAGTRWRFRVLVNGTQVTQTQHEFDQTGWQSRDVIMHAITSVTAGTAHSFEVQCMFEAGAGVLAIGNQSAGRSMTIIEL